MEKGLALPPPSAPWDMVFVSNHFHRLHLPSNVNKVIIRSPLSGHFIVTGLSVYFSAIHHLSGVYMYTFFLCTNLDRKDVGPITLMGFLSHIRNDGCWHIGNFSWKKKECMGCKWWFGDVSPLLSRDGTC